MKNFWKKIDGICERLNFFWLLVAAGLTLLGGASVGHIVQCVLNATS